MDDPRTPDELEEQRWQAYLWPSRTGAPMLVNLYGLHDEAELRAREYADTTKRALDLQLGRKHIPRTGDLAEWQAIHGHLFADIYPWAGQLRTVGMVKRDKDFLHPEDFDIYIPAVFDHASTIDWPSLDREQFVADTAWLYMHLNWIHPFREGNGRATRIFLDRFTEPARWRLDYTRIQPRALVTALDD
ncbi:Fic family protein [Nocardia sp. NPDC050710]|uniref:Fic/DOC family protein n=1 Tax=Nocardia sp. NPDC050710 TaxID=3157220 RepID=UPI0033E82015